MKRLNNLTLRNALIATHDALATAAALFASFFLRFDGELFWNRVPLLLHMLPYFVAFSVVVAYAFKLRQEPRVAVCVLGDGATSKGDFYEALNGAGVWQLPLVFVIVSLPTDRRRYLRRRSGRSG